MAVAGSTLGCFGRAYRAVRGRKLAGGRGVVAAPRNTGISAARNGRILGLYTGGCLNLTGGGRIVRTTGTYCSGCNCKLSSIEFVYNARGVRGSLRTGMDSFLKARSAVLCSSYFSTGNKLFRALLNRRSTVVDSRLGRTDVVSNIHLYGTGHFHCGGGGVRSLRTGLVRTGSYEVGLVTASNIFSVSKVITSLGDVYSLTSGCSTLIVMSSDRTINFVNRGKRNASRCYNIRNEISVVAKAFNGTLNNTSNNCASKERRVVGLLHRHSHPCLFSGALTPTVTTKAVGILRVLRDGGRCHGHLFRGATLFSGGVGRVNFSIVSNNAPVVPVVLCSRRGTIRVTGEVVRGNMCIITFSCPIMPENGTEVHARLSTTLDRGSVLAVYRGFGRIGRRVKLWTPTSGWWIFSE